MCNIGNGRVRNFFATKKNLTRGFYCDILKKVWEITQKQLIKK